MLFTGVIEEIQALEEKAQQELRDLEEKRVEKVQEREKQYQERKQEDEKRRKREREARLQRQVEFEAAQKKLLEEQEVFHLTVLCIYCGFPRVVTSWHPERCSCRSLSLAPRACGSKGLESSGT